MHVTVTALEQLYETQVEKYHFLPFSVFYIKTNSQTVANEPHVNLPESTIDNSN